MSHNHHAVLLFSSTVKDFCVDEYCIESEVVNSYIEKFGIDNARDLVKEAHTRPVDHKQKVMVVRTEFVTHEAQNALLKILEEPPVSTRFVFVVPRDLFFLPTLFSRFSKQNQVESSSENDQKIFKEFLASGYADRISAIDSAAKKKDVFWQRGVKTGLIEYLQKSPKNITDFSDLEYVARLLLTRGASNKMLLEHVALTLPTRL